MISKMYLTEFWGRGLHMIFILFLPVRLSLALFTYYFTCLYSRASGNFNYFVTFGRAKPSDPFKFWACKFQLRAHVYDTLIRFRKSRTHVCHAAATSKGLPVPRFQRPRHTRPPSLPGIVWFAFFERIGLLFQFSLLTGELLRCIGTVIKYAFTTKVSNSNELFSCLYKT